MKTWESHLIEKIHPEIGPLWAVSDADGLFRSDRVSRLLAELGAEIVLFDDPLLFRYYYEAEMRQRLEAVEQCCFVIVMDEHPDGFSRLPMDVFAACRKIEVALGDVFPRLSRNILRGLEPAIIARLWEKRELLPPHTLSDRETADLVLRLGYRIEPTMVESFADVIRYVTDLHFNNQRLSEAIAGRLQQICSGVKGTPENIGALIREPARFWEFLQGEWAMWLVGESGTARGNECHHERVPFEDSRVKVFIDNLFTEGFLAPVKRPVGTKKLPAEWCRVGVYEHGSALTTEQLIEQRAELATILPTIDATYRDWLRFANRYSAHVAAWFSADRPHERTAEFWKTLWTPMDEQFRRWSIQNLEGLHNLPPTRPVVIHHIPKFLARKVGTGEKVALLVLDGLSLSQWKLLKAELDFTEDDILINEDSCFTLLPSITNVCRQAIFSGELPIYFEKSIERTDMDGRRWKAWWDGALQKATKSQHLMVDGHYAEINLVQEVIAECPQALGMTIKMPDEIMHGAKLGWHGMHDQLRLWGRQSFLRQTISQCVSAGYKVFLTADHGNIEAIGRGKPSEGVLADRRGQRVRIYQDSTLRDRSASEMKESTMPWNSKLLPTKFLPLIHTGRGAFAVAGDILVCHGGASIDELVVPFIEFSRAGKT